MVNEIDHQLDMGRLCVLADTQFQYRQSIDIQDGNVTQKIIDRAVNYGCEVLEAHLEKIQKVLNWKDPLKLVDLEGNHPILNLS